MSDVSTAHLATCSIIKHTLYALFIFLNHCKFLSLKRCLFRLDKKIIQITAISIEKRE
jgi:hypothetical protein